jgi:hypothetical protein
MTFAGSYGLRDAEYAKFVELSPGSTAVRIIGELNVGSVDIEIGAVELKDQSSDNRATITGSQIWVNPSFGGWQCIRTTAGSPASWYAFSAQSNSVLIDNLGSTPLYYNPTVAVNVANSGTAYLDVFDSISLDLKTGSISIQASGATTPAFQLIRLS